jgi:hypothetical protein
LIGDALHFLRVSANPLRALKRAPFGSREYMDVKVPDVLATSWLIVLPNRYSVASKGRLHSDRSVSDCALQRAAEANREIEDVLVVLNREHNYSTSTPSPPRALHFHNHVLITPQHEDGLLNRQNLPFTERTYVPIWRVTPHGGHRATRLSVRL